MATTDSNRYLALQARVLALGFELLGNDEAEDERGYYVLDPKGRCIVATSAGCTLDGIDDWCREREPVTKPTSLIGVRDLLSDVDTKVHSIWSIAETLIDGEDLEQIERGVVVTIRDQADAVREMLCKVDEALEQVAGFAKGGAA